MYLCSWCSANMHTSLKTSLHNFIEAAVCSPLLLAELPGAGPSQLLLSLGQADCEVMVWWKVNYYLCNLASLDEMAKCGWNGKMCAWGGEGRDGQLNLGKEYMWPRHTGRCCCSFPVGPDIRILLNVLNMVNKERQARRCISSKPATQLTIKSIIRVVSCDKGKSWLSRSPGKYLNSWSCIWRVAVRAAVG